MLPLCLCTFLLSLTSQIAADDVAGSLPIINDLSACETDQRPLNVTNSYGYIVSPNYSDRGLTSYPDNVTCSWTLIAPNDYVILVKIILMDLNRHSSEAQLTFYDGPDENESVIDRFWGDRWRRFRSPRNVLHLKFVGEKRNGLSVPQSRGFKLYFEHQKAPVDCGKLRRCRSGEACISPEAKCNGFDDCLDGSDEENCTSTNSSSSSQCGLRPEDFMLPFIMGIVGGQATKSESWPWSVSIRLAREEPEGHHCGGSLIHKQWVITAAHCFSSESNPKVWTLSLGKTRKLVRDAGEMTRYIQKIIVHPNYDRSLRDNDIALIKMNAPVPSYNISIRPICLPDRTLNLTEVASKRPFKIIGWGETQDTSNNLILTEAEIALIDNQVCRQWLGTEEITDKMICAGYEEGGVDTCNGDSGGPLMVFWQNHWQLVGTTSFGSVCCGCRRNPGVYAKIADYLDWIEKTMSEK